MKEITLKEKSVYGNILIYPACELSQIFAGLIGKKTLTETNIKSIQALGFTVNIIRL